MSIPKPREVDDLAPITAGLDAATHEERVAWVRSLGGRDQYKLFELAKGNPVCTDDLVRADGVLRHYGKNGMPLFNKFEKRLSKIGEEIGGYNHNDFGFVKPIAMLVTGHGHFVAYDSPDEPGVEVWIDYRRVPQTQHPDFPPLHDNEHGLPALVFGNMVDIIRRVSQHVFIGDSFKNLPREDRPPFLARVGSVFPTAPFVMCQDHE